MSEESMLQKAFSEIGKRFDYIEKKLRDRDILPPGAVRIEYLESTGTQYVDSGIAPTPTTVLDCSGVFLYTVPGARFGSRASATSECFYVAGVTTGGADVERFSLGLSGTSTELQRYADQKTLSRFVIDAVSKSAALEYADGTSGTLSFSQQAFAGSYPLFLLAFNNAGTASCSIAGTRLSVCRILNGSVLIRDFIPVRIGTVGYLYDKVSRQLFGNSGTGNFTLGPDIVEVEYIQSTGTQRIAPESIPSGYSFDLGIETTQTSGDVLQFGQTTKIGLGQLNSKWRVWILNTATVTTVSQTEYPSIVMRYNSSGTTILSPDYTSLWNLGNVVNSTIIPYIGGMMGSSWFGGKSKFKFLKVWNSSGELVNDYIPVRSGQDGCIFDRLKCKLYSNEGSGSFILGPDKA